ncbi:acylphosphatase [Nocardioides sp. YIM 152315]|uniref:acylphosphatase n=1 Tax=Nocardioides sp. YIM 152315 TaxID=3031760 RepID=UPI0023DA5726|nr:acylphosphatase [Nocardioides sp. YIM 152315]MDF1605093.1 acylphosphatase [Nocardioides sp. YIM 152315]
MPASARRVVDVVVTGRVQGVSFRYHAERTARGLGVAGWVRNEPGGSVAAHLEGDPETVEAMLDWLRQGPPAASVDRVDVTPATPTGARSFEVRS